MPPCRTQRWRLLVLATGSPARDTIGFPLRSFSWPWAKLRSLTVDYFDSWRRERNVMDYDDAFVATETEAKEIVTKAKEFVEVAEQWVEKNHSSLRA